MRRAEKQRHDTHKGPFETQGDIPIKLLHYSGLTEHTLQAKMLGTMVTHKNTSLTADLYPMMN